MFQVVWIITTGNYTMGMSKLPCLKYVLQTNPPFCGDNKCKIGKMNLCKAFIIFAKHIIKKRRDLPDYLSIENHKEIEENTRESILKSIDNFHGRKGYMDQAFMKFCKWHYRNRFGDYLRRSSQKKFEDHKLIIETNIQNSDDDDNGISFLDIIDRAIPNQKRSGKPMYSFKKPDSMKANLLLLLDGMKSKGDVCARMLNEWISLARDYTDKEIALLKGMKPNNYTKQKNRCIMKLKKRFPVFLMIQQLNCKNKITE